MNDEGAAPKSFEIYRAIRTDHPSLAGHFPGNPIVPGVVILEEVAAALSEWRKEGRLTEIRAAKFISALKPGQPFTILLTTTRASDMEVDFSCSAEGGIIAEGRCVITRSLA